MQKERLGRGPSFPYPSHGPALPLGTLVNPGRSSRHLSLANSSIEHGLSPPSARGRAWECAWPSAALLAEGHWLGAL